MAETALAFALKNAGVNTDAALLYAMATDELRRVGGDPGRALSPFVEEVRDTGGIWTELISVAETREAARRYLATVAGDMQGGNLKVPAQAGDGVQESGSSQGICGPIDNSEGGRVHQLVHGQKGTSQSPSDPKAEGASANVVGVTIPVARSSATPNKPRGLAALQIHAKVNSAYICRNGQAVEDVEFSSLPRLAKERRNEAGILSNEAKLFDAIYKHATPVSGNVRVGEVVKFEELRAMIKGIGFDA